MKTKKSDDFIKHASKRPKTKFAVIGAGTTWTFYEGADLAKAVPSKGETMIKATAQKSQAALKMLVVGGTPEVNVFRTRVFARQLKTDPKALTFKTVPVGDDAQLDQLESELDGALVEQVGMLPLAARQLALPLLNQAKALAEDGDVAGAKTKVLELKKQLEGGSDTPPPREDDEAAQRKRLLGQLQGPLVGQVARLKSPQRDPLIKLLNEAIKLAKEGDLQLGLQKAEQLKQTLDRIPPPLPSTPAPSQPPVVTTPTQFKDQLNQAAKQYKAVVKLSPPNKATLESLMTQITQAGKQGNLNEGAGKLRLLEAEMKVAAAFAQLRAEKNLDQRIKLCEDFLAAFKDHPNEVALVEDLYAEARRLWGQQEAQKAYGQQIQGISDPSLNPGNQFATQHTDEDDKNLIFNPAVVKKLAKKTGLSEEEVLAIRTFTASDYSYINPAVANQEDHPENQKQNSKGEKVTWMDAQHKPDPDKGRDMFDRMGLEEELEEYNKGKKRSLREEGSLHAAMMMQAFKKLPKKSGKLYRGARMNMARFNSEYAVGKKIPLEAFQSQSVSAAVARSFADGTGNVKLPDDATVSVFVEVQVHDARDISAISVYGASEKEWLLPPGGFLLVKSIEDDKQRNEGHPKATHWKKVKMEQVFS